MTEDSNQTDEPRKGLTGGRAVALAVSLTLMLGSGIVTVPLGGLGAMFTADCNDADDRAICSDVGSSLLILGPLGGLVIGAVLSVVGAVLVFRRRHLLAPWLLAAWGVWAVGTAVPFVLTAQEQSPESERREEAMYEAEDARRHAEAMAEYRTRPSLEEAGPRLDTLRSEVDAALGHRGTLRWAPMVQEDATDSGCEAPGRMLWLKAEVAAERWPQWPAIADAISAVAHEHRMRDTSAPRDHAGGERFFEDTDGSQISARIDANRTVVLMSDCRLTAEDKANLPR